MDISVINFALPGSLSLRTQKKNLEVLLEVVDESKKVFSLREAPIPKMPQFSFGGGGGLYVNMEKILAVNSLKNG